MAIQVRRGLKKDFDPNKLLPGEWAVSVDTSTSNQIVWMCFAAGVVKRMGTYEDFMAQIEEITGDILQQFITRLTEAAQELQNNVEVYIQGKIDNEWTPELEKLVERAESAAESAKTSEINAKDSENNTKKYEQNATDSATIATKKATDAKNSAVAASGSASAAAEGAKTSAEKAKEASGWADLAESFTHGRTGVRENEDIDNAEAYYQQTKQIAQNVNGIVNMGNITFAGLATVDKIVNHMYNVTDAFVSDETFNDGGGVSYGPGNNVIWTGDGLWDVTASSSVSGVKGNKETYFRQGNVNITPENIGALPENGTAVDSKKWGGKTPVFLSEAEFQKIPKPDINSVYFRYKE